MKKKSSFLLIVLTLLLGGCAIVDFGPLSNRLKFWETNSTCYGCHLEPVEDDERLARYQLPEDAIQTNGLLLEILAAMTQFPNDDSLFASLTNNSDTAINIWELGNLDSDQALSFIAIDERGNILHEFFTGRIYSKESFGTTQLAPGELLVRSVKSCLPFGITNFEKVSVNTPTELVIVAKFEQPEGYEDPAIGPIYSKPKRFRLTKIPVVH